MADSTGRSVESRIPTDTAINPTDTAIKMMPMAIATHISRTSLDGVFWKS
jgi:hypothetical protein